MRVNQWKKLTSLLLLLSILLIYLIVLQFRLPSGPGQWQLQDPNRSSASVICTAEPNQCVPPLRAFEKRFRVVPRYKINFCAIEKNMSTVLTAIFCFLFDEERFRQRRRTINEELFHRRLCKRRNEAFSFSGLAKQFNVSKGSLESDWLHLAVLRDPMDRFLSGFVDKCVLERSWLNFPERCNGCRNNLSCFLERQFERAQKFGWQKARLNSFDDRHFFPQNWRCQFNEHFRHFTPIRYSPTAEGVRHFFDHLFAILRERGVPEQSIQFVQNQTIQGRTPHSTWERRQRQRGEQLLRENPRLMRLLIRMYYYDFVLFGYPIPSLGI